MPLFGSGHEVVTSTTRPSVPIAGQLIYETDTKNTMIYNGASWIQQTNNTLQAITTDASGRVRTTFQPICQLYNTVSRAAGTIIPWTGTYVNTGSMWNGATRVTVPIAGTYLVTFEGMSTNAVSSIFIDVYKNGSAMSTVRQYAYNASTGHKQIALHVYISLAANDYIEWRNGGDIMYADAAGYMHASVALVA